MRSASPYPVWLQNLERRGVRLVSPLVTLRRSLVGMSRVWGSALGRGGKSQAVAALLLCCFYCMWGVKGWARRKRGGASRGASDCDGSVVRKGSVKGVHVMVEVFGCVVERDFVRL